MVSNCIFFSLRLPFFIFFLSFLQFRSSHKLSNKEYTCSELYLNFIVQYILFTLKKNQVLWWLSYISFYILLGYIDNKMVEVRRRTLKTKLDYKSCFLFIQYCISIYTLDNKSEHCLFSGQHVLNR